MRTIKMSRAAGIDPNPNDLAARARTAFSAIGGRTVHLVATRDQGGLHGYLVVPDQVDNAQMPAHIAHAVGGKVNVVENSEVLEQLAEAKSFGWLQATGSTQGRELQVGADPAEFARQLAVSLEPGSFVAVSLRKPTTKEMKVHKTWIAHALGAASPQHHSNTSNALVMSAFAGADDPDSVDRTLSQFASAMNGFDIATKTHTASLRRYLSRGIVGALLFAVAAIGVGYIPAVRPWVPGVVTIASGLLWGAAVISVMLGAARSMGWLPSFDLDVIRAARTLQWPVPPKRAMNPKPPRKEKVRRDRDGNERIEPEFDGDYPMDAKAFLVGSNIVVGMIAPQAGALSGTTITKERQVPPVLLANIGPAIGESVSGRVHMDASSMLFGTGIIGDPGSGKSQLMRSLAGWCMAEKNCGSQVSNGPGARNAIIAFESKDFDGVKMFQHWAAATGDPLITVDVAEPGSFGIDIMDIPGNAEQRATFLTDAFRYAFGDSAVGPASYSAFLSIFSAAGCISDDLLDGAAENGIETGKSLFYYANILLGNQGDSKGIALFNHLKAVESRMSPDDPRKPDLRAAVDGLRSIYDLSQSARNAIIKAPANKVRTVVAMENWWGPNRQKVSWREILTGHRSVVINLGTSEDGMVLGEEQKSEVASILMFALEHAIRRTCVGWQARGEYVSIFSDELSMLAPFSPDVITGLRDQGRSSGVRLHFATQRVEQLQPLVRTAFLTFSNLVSFKQDSRDVAEQVAREMSGEDEWTFTDIQHLARYQGAFRLSADNHRQPTFLCRVSNLEGDIEGTIRDWGYQPGMVVAAPVPNAAPAAKELDDLDWGAAPAADDDYDQLAREMGL